MNFFSWRWIFFISLPLTQSQKYKPFLLHRISSRSRWLDHRRITTTTRRTWGQQHEPVFFWVLRIRADVCVLSVFFCVCLFFLLWDGEKSRQQKVKSYMLIGVSLLLVLCSPYSSSGVLLPVSCWFLTFCSLEKITHTHIDRQSSGSRIHISHASSPFLPKQKQKLSQTDRHLFSCFSNLFLFHPAIRLFSFPALLMENSCLGILLMPVFSWLRVLWTAVLGTKIFATGVRICRLMSAFASSSAKYCRVLTPFPCLLRFKLTFHASLSSNSAECEGANWSVVAVSEEIGVIRSFISLISPLLLWPESCCGWLRFLDSAFISL